MRLVCSKCIMISTLYPLFRGADTTFNKLLDNAHMYCGCGLLLFVLWADGEMVQISPSAWIFIDMATDSIACSRYDRVLPKSKPAAKRWRLSSRALASVRPSMAICRLDVFYFIFLLRYTKINATKKNTINNKWQSHGYICVNTSYVHIMSRRIPTHRHEVIHATRCIHIYDD